VSGANAAYVPLWGQSQRRHDQGLGWPIRFVWDVRFHSAILTLITLRWPLKRIAVKITEPQRQCAMKVRFGRSGEIRRPFEDA
jgi:hypothetical protein